MSKVIAYGISSEWKQIARDILMGHLPENAVEIYSGRNRIIRAVINGTPVAIKFFSRSLKNKLIYSVFASKAKRSYLYGREILNRGIHTPQPLAYAERRGVLNTLQDSIYICRFEEATDLRQYLQTGEQAWIQFARFAATLHDKGILHRDLNSTNVRVNILPDGKTRFSLIDLNRMRLLPDAKIISRKDSGKNLVRFSYLTPEFNSFAKEYSRARKNLAIDPISIINAKRHHEKQPPIKQIK